MEQKYCKEESLKCRVKSLLKHKDLVHHQELIKRLANELDVSILECAAALSLINQPRLYSAKADEKKPEVKTNANLSQPVVPKQRVVRYRLDIGSKHKVQVDEIKNVLVEVSGVDRKRITKVDIRNHYTLVDLPEGMTADIFQLLSEAEINTKKLNIKRVKFHRRFHRRNSNKQTA